MNSGLCCQQSLIILVSRYLVFFIFNYSCNTVMFCQKNNVHTPIFSNKHSFIRISSGKSAFHFSVHIKSLFDFNRCTSFCYRIYFCINISYILFCSSYCFCNTLTVNFVRLKKRCIFYT